MVLIFYSNSGKNWKNKLTVPTLPNFTDKWNNISLEQVNTITKPAIRNGEIVKDAWIKIDRHENYKKSQMTDQLRTTNINDKEKEPLFDENVDFEQCVDFLHNQISSIEF